MSVVPLFVPMKLDALVVNTQVRKLPFRRWATSYDLLSSFASPTPAAFQGELEASFDQERNEGVYLLWTLPAALRHGTHVQGKLEFPLVPNRWLVVRMAGAAAARKATAWVVESDCPSTDSDSATLYLVDPEIVQAWLKSSDPRRNTKDSSTVRLIGTHAPLAGWTERGIDQLFLRAVAPGNPMFTAYQPNVRDIFSFHDRPSGDGIDQGTLSYLVAGWYSNPAEDPLGRWSLDELGWNVDPKSPGVTRTFCHAMVHGVDWDRGGKVPPNAPQQITNLHVAIGNTTADAFKALVERQIQDRATEDPQVADLLKRVPGVADLLEAFQYDLLGSLDQPGGEALLQQRIHAAWFGSNPGGYRWTIADAPPAAGAELKKIEPKSAEQRAAEARQETWLDALNAAQAAYDDLETQLRAARWQLYAAWWKRGRFNTFPPFAQPAGVTGDQLDAAFGQCQRTVLALAGRADPIRSSLPQPVPTPSGNPADAFQKGIDDFAAAKRKAGQLAKDRVLKAVPAPRLWQAGDPVVLISGARNTHRIDPNETLACRVAERLVRSITVKGKTLGQDQLGGPLSKIDAGQLDPALQGPLQGLYTEFLFLDPGSAPILAPLLGNIDAGPLSTLIEAYAPETFGGGGGVLPALPLARWAQPWNPLFMEWKVAWYPMGYRSAAGAPCWSFDGTDYHSTEAVRSDPVKPRAVAGRTFLTPQTSFTFKSRLSKLIAEHPEAKDLAALDALIGQIDQWDFLSQSLEGFSDTLAGIDRRANRTPDDPEVVEQIGGETGAVPLLPDDPPASFPGIRQGQFTVEKLILYGAFGQVLEVVNTSGLKSAERFRPILARTLVPDRPVVPGGQAPAIDPGRLVQLPPAPLQHARLDFRLVDSGDATRPADLSENANPIGGWLVASHADHAILLYDRDGASLGELRLTETAKGQRVPTWQGPPDRPGETLDRAPMVRDLVNGLKDQAASVFDDFMAVIDTALWTIDPGASRGSEGLATMVGRPLALVRAGLRFKLDGPPIHDMGWASTANPRPPDFLKYDFDVRLGDQAVRKDGLIGYFLDGDSRTFHCVPASAPANGYLLPVAPGGYVRLRFDESSKADLVLLVDPTASVHAFTGLLPVKEIALPNRFVQPALRRMELTFTAGPLLVEARPPAGGGGETEPALTVPVPAAQDARWSWLQPHKGLPPASAPLAPVDDRARLSQDPVELREGFLRLTPTGK